MQAHVQMLRSAKHFRIAFWSGNPEPIVLHGTFHGCCPPNAVPQMEVLTTRPLHKLKRLAQIEQSSSSGRRVCVDTVFLLSFSPSFQVVLQKFVVVTRSRSHIVIA